jgi:hypothetical protein
MEEVDGSNPSRSTNTSSIPLRSRHPLRALVADKPGLTGKGFNFIGTNGTVEFTAGKTRYHITVHGEGAPVKWDRFHVKICDLRFGARLASDYDVYFQIANTEGTILAQNNGVVKKDESTAVTTAIAGYMAAL